MYIVERKLGKGGFGQVYVGRRAVATTAKDGPNANFVRTPCCCCLSISLSCSCVRRSLRSLFFHVMAMFVVLWESYFTTCSSLQT